MPKVGESTYLGIHSVIVTQLSPELNAKRQGERGYVNSRELCDILNNRHDLIAGTGLNITHDTAMKHEVPNGRKLQK